MVISKQKTVFIALGIFSFLLAFFVFGNGWYVPAKLVIRGFAPEMNAELAVSWDSGAGWNPYEQEIFHVNTVPAPEAAGKHSIVIQSTGEKHADALGAKVVCSGIRVDGKKIDLKKHVNGGRNDTAGRNKGTHIINPEEAMHLTLPAKEHIHIELLTNKNSGKVNISVNGRSTAHDLYMAKIIW